MYLDPGFGSMIIQLVVAAIATCGAFLIILKNKIFGKKDESDKSLPADDVSIENGTAVDKEQK